MSRNTHLYLGIVSCVVGLLLWAMVGFYWDLRLLGIWVALFIGVGNLVIWGVTRWREHASRTKHPSEMDSKPRQ